MSHGPLSLLKSRRFLPLFVAQFTVVANDNLFKNAMAVLVIFKLADQSFLPPPILVSLATGIFILPYFLFSATASQIADRFDKSRAMQAAKLSELLIVALGGASLLLSNIPLMMVVLFLLGVESTIFGLLKYSVLPEYLDADDLIDGNALIEGGTFLAILLGTIGGSLTVTWDEGPLLISIVMGLLALAGFAATCLQPPAHLGNPETRISPNLWRSTWRVLDALKTHRDLIVAVAGISWFWSMGATYLSQFPTLAKHILGADERAVTLMLVMFSLGIGFGSVLCGRVLGGRVTARYVPLAGLVMAAFAFDLWLTISHLPPPPPEALPMGIGDFLSNLSSWRLLGDLGGLTLAGGLFIVPLYTLLQVLSSDAERAGTIASNNIINAGLMVATTVVTALALKAGLTLQALFLTVAIITAGVSLLLAVNFTDQAMRK